MREVKLSGRRYSNNWCVFGILPAITCIQNFNADMKMGGNTNLLSNNVINDRY